MIAVTFALPAESRTFISRLQNKRRIPSPGGDVTCGRIGSRSLTIFHTGVGRSIAEKKLPEFFEQRSFGLLISSGFAGGVAADLNAADLFLAKNVSDSQLLAIAQQILTDARGGKLLTSSGIVHSSEQRVRLARERGADAIDMETDVIAQACREREVPMLSLRAISDTQREPFPAPPGVLFDIEQQRTNIPSLARYLITKPNAIASFVRFARQVARARENLTTALIRLLQSDSLD